MALRIPGCASATRYLSRLAGVAIAATVVAQSGARAADIDVILDQARLIKLPDRASAIVIGNPSIADATLQAGGTMVVTGKGYGVTNVIALDRTGTVLMEKSVEVRGPSSNVIVIYRGTERESYSCTPTCERRVTLGDGPAYFDASAAQAISRNGLAQGVTTAQPNK